MEPNGTYSQNGYATNGSGTALGQVYARYHDWYRRWLPVAAPMSKPAPPHGYANSNYYASGFTPSQPGYAYPQQQQMLFP